MADRDDMIRGLAALVAAVLAGDRAAARARGGDLASLLGLSGVGDLGAVEAALLTALRFDPVGLIEIAAMTGDSPQSVNYLMGLPGAPEPAQLARGKVWPRQPVAEYFARIGDRGAGGRRTSGSAAYLAGPHDGQEPVPVTGLRAGQVIEAGTVVSTRYSKSGESIYITVRDAEGAVRELPHRPAAGRIRVYTEPPAGT